jgi:hypothetical protein
VRIYSNKIARIFKKYYLNKDLKIFAISGDIDNLGIFVSRRGRAEAEILVDSYNRIMGKYFYDLYTDKNKFVDFVIIPSGEEIFVIGLAKKIKDVNESFEVLKNNINRFIFANSPILDKKVTVSFGCSLIDDCIKQRELNKFVKCEGVNVDDANNSYINISRSIREKLAKEMDLSKFSDLLNREDLSIFLRNIVHLNTLNNKKETRILIKRIIQIIEGDKNKKKVVYKSIFNKKRGLSKNEKELFNLLKNIDPV